MFVVEIGAPSLAPLLAAVRLLVGSTEGPIEVVRRGSEEDCLFVPFEAEIEEALAALERGDVSAVMILLTEQSPARSIILFRPHFGGHGVRHWYGVVDGLTERAAAGVEPLRDVSELTFASVAVEDTLDLEEVGEINAQTFPWDHWRLVEAAVAEGGDFGAAQRRTGPAFDKSPAR